jgi:hypothetical protein
MKLFAILFVCLASTGVVTSQPAPRSAEETDMTADATTVIEADHIWGTRWTRDDETGEWNMAEIDCLDITDEENQRVEEAGQNKEFFECPFPTIVLPDGTTTIATVVRKTR